MSVTLTGQGAIAPSGKVVNFDQTQTAEDVAAAIQARAGSAGAFSFRNKIVDGRLDFWYEGITKSALSNGYGTSTLMYDACQSAAVGFTRTITQQPLVAGVDLPAIDVPSAKYFYRTVLTDTLAGSTAFSTFYSPVEDVTTLAGKLVTLSFYAKASAVKNIGVEISQYFGSGGSAQTFTPTQLISLSTTWNRYSVQFLLPSVSGKTIAAGSCLTPQFWLSNGTSSGITGRATGVIQQAGTFDIACIQLEEGSVATQFEELPMVAAECVLLRYFVPVIRVATNLTVGGSFNGGLFAHTFTVPMRGTPVITITSDSGTKTTSVQGLSASVVTFQPSSAAGYASDYIYSVAKADARL